MQSTMTVVVTSLFTKSTTSLSCILEDGRLPSGLRSMSLVFPVLYLLRLPTALPLVGTRIISSKPLISFNPGEILSYLIAIKRSAWYVESSSCLMRTLILLPGATVCY
jgi:hypothetical protein